MKKLRLISGLICLLTAAVSQAGNGDVPAWKNEVKLHAGAYLNNEGALLGEISYSRLFNRYIGVGIGLEVTRQVGQNAYSTVFNGQLAIEEEKYANIGWGIVNPYVVLRTPRFLVNEEQEREFWFQAEPGVGLGLTGRSVSFKLLDYAPGVQQVKDIKTFEADSYRWLIWRSRFSFNMAWNKWLFGIGFCISNLDYYSARRRLKLPDGQLYSVPARQLSYSLDLSVGFQFGIRKPVKTAGPEFY